MCADQKEANHFFQMAPESFHGKIPFIVTDLITELRRRNCEDAVGIFRLNGSDTQTRELCDALDKGKVTDWSPYDIHTVSTALKRYFRQMAETEPLVPMESYDCIIAVVNIRDTMNSMDINDSIVEKLAKVIEQMPKIRMLTLGYLCKFLVEIAAKKEVNKMNEQNIAICFAPNILTMPDLPPTEIAEQSKLANTAFQLILENFDKIFPNFHVDESMYCNEDDFSLFNAPPFNVVHIQTQIFRCNFRRNHIIPFVPLCRLVDADVFQRPARPAPGIDENEDDLASRQAALLTTRLSNHYHPSKVLEASTFDPSLL